MFPLVQFVLLFFFNQTYDSEVAIGAGGIRLLDFRS